MKESSWGYLIPPGKKELLRGGNLMGSLPKREWSFFKKKLDYGLELFKGSYSKWDYLGRRALLRVLGVIRPRGVQMEGSRKKVRRT